MKNHEHLGPLKFLVGTWTGEGGKDLSPEPDGTEENIYHETITFTPIGDVDNAEEQELVGVHYHQVVHRTRDSKHLHDQSGYWMWEKESGAVIHSLSIPRGVTVVTEGTAEEQDNGIKISVATDPEKNHISETSFMANKAKTLSHRAVLEVSDAELRYKQTTLVDIYGREFKHIDENTLLKQA